MIEADSWSFNGDHRAHERDCVRHTALAVAGYRVLRVTGEQVMTAAPCVRAVLDDLVVPPGTGFRTSGSPSSWVVPDVCLGAMSGTHPRTSTTPKEPRMPLSTRPATRAVAAVLAISAAALAACGDDEVAATTAYPVPSEGLCADLQLPDLLAAAGLTVRDDVVEEHRALDGGSETSCTLKGVPAEQAFDARPGLEETWSVSVVVTVDGNGDVDDMPDDLDAPVGPTTSSAGPTTTVSAPIDGWFEQGVELRRMTARAADGPPQGLERYRTLLLTRSVRDHNVQARVQVLDEYLDPDDGGSEADAVSRLAGSVMDRVPDVLGTPN